MSRQLLLFKLKNASLLGSDAAEGLPVAERRVEDGEELSHTSNESHLLDFASFQQLLVLGPDQGVVAGGYQGGHVEHTADFASPTFGLAVASFLATVIVHGCHTNKGCNFLA